MAKDRIVEEDDPDKFFSRAYMNYQQAYPEDWKDRLMEWQDTNLLTTKVDVQERKRQFAKLELSLYRFVRFYSYVMYTSD